jgi:hypothetical protein
MVVFEMFAIGHVIHTFLFNMFLDKVTHVDLVQQIARQAFTERAVGWQIQAPVFHVPMALKTRITLVQVA